MVLRSQRFLPLPLNMLPLLIRRLARIPLHLVLRRRPLILVTGNSTLIRDRLLHARSVGRVPPLCCSGRFDGGLFAGYGLRVAEVAFCEAGEGGEEGAPSWEGVSVDV